jgi:uncharacterized protein (TIGR02246 family)
MVGLRVGVAVMVLGAVVGMCGCHSDDAETVAPGAAPAGAAATSATAASADGVDPRITGETEIRGLDAELQKAITSGDAVKAASYYDDGATVMVPGQAAAEGRDHIAREFMGLMAMPGFAFTFTPETVMVAKSGEMAYEHGDYSMTLDDKMGAPTVTKARYVVVWTKAADGSWKILIDAPTTTR